MKNDYELIYLYKETSSEEALIKLINKYKRLIWKNIYKFYVPISYHDDFYQEGLITLVNALNTFDSSYNKTFTRYFELILYRRFIALKKESPKYVLAPKPELFFKEEPPPFFIFFDLKSLSDFEKRVWDLYYNERKIIKSIAEILKTDEKSIKNAIYRIKCKLKEQLWYNILVLTNVVNLL